MKDLFELRILEHHWVQKDGDDPDDLCSHGYVFAKIGEEIVCNSDIMDVTTSAAGLHLMRTLSDDYTPGDYAGQLLPCCGFFITFGKDGLIADAHGCPGGIDWTVIHKDGLVKITSDNGIEVTIPFKLYKDIVLSFAEEVELFYNRSKTKIIPNDEFTADGYRILWDEWHRHKKKWTVS